MEPTTYESRLSLKLDSQALPSESGFIVVALSQTKACRIMRSIGQQHAVNQPLPTWRAFGNVVSSACFGQYDLLHLQYGSTMHQRDYLLYETLSAGSVPSHDDGSSIIEVTYLQNIQGIWQRPLANRTSHLYGTKSGWVILSRTVTVIFQYLSSTPQSRPPRRFPPSYVLKAGLRGSEHNLSELATRN